MGCILHLNHIWLFLKRLYHEWRSLFWALLLFIAAQFFFMAKGIENVPFFLYHMYGQQHPPTDSSVVYLIKMNGYYFDHNGLSNREQEMLMNPVIYYTNLIKDGDGTFETAEKRFEPVAGEQTMSFLQEQLCNDSIALSAFPQWWGRYFKPVSKNKYGPVSVVRSYVYSKYPYQKSATDSLVFTVNLK